MASPTGHVSFIWGIAQRLRGAFKRHEYGSIILPLTLLRRLDQVLVPTKAEVLAEAAKYRGRGLNLDRMLQTAAGQLFYNTSKLTLEKAHADSDHLAAHLLEYVAGFDPVVRDIFEAFEFETSVVKRLDKAGRLYSVLGQFLDPELNLHPDVVPNDAMGDIFEELIRRFSEVSNATAGEHFTPREVVRLCAELVLAGDEKLAATPNIIRSVYDPACGTGGMLSVMDELVRERNPQARLVLFGQELNPESWAICRAEMLVRGQDPSRIASGSTLSTDGTAGRTFDFMLANPPFGVDWSDDYEAVVKESEQLGFGGRFGAGYPPAGNGALLFLQTMLAKAKPAGEDAGSRMAIVFNASPMFGGGAGSAESNIRRWIIDSDWLETVVALPEQLFYNTGLQTYIWVLTDRKEARRKGVVQLVDARDLWEPMPQSYGFKRRRLSVNDIATVLVSREEFELDGERSKVRANSFFGYRTVKLERPLRLRYRAGDASVEALRSDPLFTSDDGEARNEDMRGVLETVLRRINGLEATRREDMDAALSEALAGQKLTAPYRAALWAAVAVGDVDGEAVRNKKGELEPDVELRDDELVPLDNDVDEYFDREVRPFDALAWPSVKNSKIGYQIPFTRLFYRPKPLRALEEIERDIEQLEGKEARLRSELAEKRSTALAKAVADRPRNARLGFIGRWMSGGTPPRSDLGHWSGDMPWASSKDLHVERLYDTKEHITDDAAEEHSRLIEPGTLLIATRGMSLAKRLPMALAMKPMAFNQDLKAIAPAPHVNSEYLRLVLRAFEPEVLSLAVEAAHGTKRIETPVLKAFRIPLPDLDEQVAIASDTLAVEETLFELDRLLVRHRELLAEHRQALISTALGGGSRPAEVA